MKKKKKISADQESKHDEPETRVYEILNINKFTSHRKRMSVVVRTETGELRLLVKGADDAVLPVVKAGSDKVKLFSKDYFPPPPAKFLSRNLFPLRSSEISFFLLSKKIFVRPSLWNKKNSTGGLILLDMRGGGGGGGPPPKKMAVLKKIIRFPHPPPHPLTASSLHPNQ